MLARGQRETDGALGTLCVGCHAPMAVREGATADGLDLDEIDPALVEVHLRESPLSGTMFVFRNQRGNALKLLIWSAGGFVLVYKKLERGRFRVPAAEADRTPLTLAEITAILEGIDLGKAKRLPRWEPP
jgi:transposase